MAGIDKIYGTRAQRRELKRFIGRLRIPGAHKRAMYRCFYPVNYTALTNSLTNFDCWMDRLLLKQPNLPAWARKAIQFQYNGELPPGRDPPRKWLARQGSNLGPAHRRQ